MKRQNLLIYAFCASLPLSIAGINIAAALLSAAVLWQALSDRPLDWSRLRNPGVYALGLYIAAAALCSAAGVGPARSFSRLPRDLHKAWILGLLLLALPRDRSTRLERPLALGFAAAALVGIVQALTQHSGEAWVRAHAFVHPVTFGELLALAWLGGVCFWIKPPDGGTPRGWTLAFLATTGLALVLSQTRGALLGLAAGLGVLCWLQKFLRRKAWWAALGLAAVLIVWELMPTGGRSLLDLLTNLHLRRPSGELNPFMARAAFWEVAWRIFLDYPLLGVGPGHYGTVFAGYFQGSFDGERVWGSAHNLYLHHLAERGFVGAAALAVAIGALTARAWRLAAERAGAWTLWAAAALPAFWVMNLTEVAWETEQAATFLLFLCAAAEAQAGRVGTRP